VISVISRAEVFFDGRYRTRAGTRYFLETRAAPDDQVKSKRSRVITLVQAFTKSRTNFAWPSEEA